MIWPQGGSYMDINVHAMWKYICNRIALVIKGPHVQVWIDIYKRSCINYWEWNCEVWKVFGYLEGVPLLFKELLCNLSILELCTTLEFCTWCVLLLFYDILSTWIITTCLQMFFQVDQGKSQVIKLVWYNVTWYFLSWLLWLLT